MDISCVLLVEEESGLLRSTGKSGQKPAISLTPLTAFRQEMVMGMAGCRGEVGGTSGNSRLPTGSKSGNARAMAFEFPVRYHRERRQAAGQRGETGHGSHSRFRNDERYPKSRQIRLHPGAPKDSRARKIAEEAHDPASGDSFLRGKAEFERAAAALMLLPDSSENGKIRFRVAGEETLTQAGMVVALWQKAAEDRTTIFSGTGALGPTILVVQVAGVDLNTLWSDDEFGEALKANGNADASVRVFETQPALVLPKRPDPDNGVIIAEQGEQVSVKRRGNTSRWDPKVNISVYLDDDEESGIPRQLNLINSLRDPSYRRIRLAFDLLGLARCPVRPNMYAELTLNGKYYGTYVAMPPMDEYHFKTWLPGVKHRAIFKGNYGDDLPGGAPLEPRGILATDYFTPGSHPESRTYEPRLDTPDSDYAALASFLAAFHANDPKSASFVDTARRILDVEGFLRTMAVVNLLGSWDTYYLNSHNYFLHLAVDDSANQPPFATFFLNDVDSLLGVSWPGQKRNWQDKDLLFRGTEIGRIPLITKLLANELFRNYYLDFMEWFVAKHFNVGRVRLLQAPHAGPFSSDPCTWRRTHPSALRIPTAGGRTTRSIGPPFSIRP
jgi:hypothetical protein